MQHREPESFGAYVYNLRQARGWTLREAASQAGISHSRLTEIESGMDTHSGKGFRPSYTSVIKLARAYEVPADVLLHLAGHEPGAELTTSEWRLVGIYRRLPEARRSDLLAFAERLDAEAASES